MFSPKLEAKLIEKVPDPNTGETIHRYSLPPECIKTIEGAIKDHSDNMNQFAMNGMTFFDILDFQIKLKEKIKTSDGHIKTACQKVIKDCKLDMKLPWRWNMPLRLFEYATSPTVVGMNKAEIEASLNPTAKPTIIDAGGIGVK